MFKIVLPLLTALALLPLSAQADESPAPLSVAGIPLSGKVFTDIYAPTSDFGTETYRQVSASLWLQGDPRLNDQCSAHFILTSDAFDMRTGTPNTTSSGLRTQLREGYVTYLKNGFEIRAGKQIIPWGKADVINPTDVLSAKDYTFFNPDDEVRRVGATSLWFSWTPLSGTSPWNFTIVATPIFPQTQLLVPPNLTPANTSISATPLLAPQTLANTETAFKVAYSGASWDASLMAFRGWNHVSEYTLTGISIFPTPSVSVAPVFHRIRAAGGDFSVTLGNWIFRGETAYKWTENGDGKNPLIIPSHWDSVIGVERPLGDDFRVQAQLVYRAFPAYLSPDQAGGDDPITAMANSEIAKANALLLGYQFKTRVSPTFRLSYTNEATGIDTELFVLVNIQGGDSLVRPKFAYNWTDALKTTVGLDYYGGPDDRQLGALKVFNSLFLEAKYTF